MPTDHNNVNSLDALANTELVGHFIERLNTLSKNFLQTQRILCKYLDTIAIEDQRQIHRLCVTISSMAEKARSALESIKNGVTTELRFAVIEMNSGSIKKSTTPWNQPAAEIVSLFTTLVGGFTHALQQLTTFGRLLTPQCQALLIPLSEIQLATNWTGLNLPAHSQGKKASHTANNTYYALMNNTFTPDSKVAEGQKVSVSETRTSVPKLSPEFSLAKNKGSASPVIEVPAEPLSLKMP